MGYLGRKMYTHCTSKIKFASKEEAKAARPDQKVYRCTLCNSYHLYSTPKRRGKRV